MGDIQPPCVMDDRAPPATTRIQAAARWMIAPSTSSASCTWAGGAASASWRDAHTFAGAGDQVAGGSTHLRLSQNWFLDAQAVGSHDADLDGADGAAASSA